MTFSRVKPAGWTHPDPITAAQINQLDADHANAIDGMAGGEYSPGADIKLPGANGIEWGDGRYPKCTSRDLVRMQPLIIAGQSSFGSPDFFLNGAATVSFGCLTQNYVDTGGTNVPWLVVPITNLIDLATLTSIAVQIKPTSTSEPAQPPKIRLYKSSFNGSSPVSAEVVDPTTGSAYGDAHDWAINLSEAIDQTDNAYYFLRFYGEAGSGANAGLDIRFIRAHFTATLLTPG